MSNLNITLDLSYDSFVEYFGSGKVSTDFFDKIIWFNINGKEVKMQPTHFMEDNSCGSAYFPRVQVILAPYIDKKVKAAEEAVAKAKEALKAAENALKVVKESK